MPKHPQAATATSRPFGFNKTLHMDVKYLWDCRGKKYAALSVLDLGTCKHDAHLIKTRRSDYVASKFLRKWIQPYGCPELIVHDQGGEFEGAFVNVLEQFSISSKVTAAHAAWQLGIGERHGDLLGQALQSIVEEHSIEGYSKMKEALACACMAKNATVSRDGYTPNQRVYGVECSWPSLTEEAPGLSYLEGVSTETEAARAHRMRTTARVALIRQDVQDKMRRAILRKPAVSQGPFMPGSRVYFWVPSQKARYKPGGTWRGPATVVVKEAIKKYFVSWRGRLLLLAEENLRLATKDELALNEPVREEIIDLQGVLRDPSRSNSYQDMRSLQPPPSRPRKRVRVVEPDNVERKQARRMLRGSKAVSRLLRQRGLQPERSSKKSHKRRLEPQPDEDYNKRVREAEEDLDRSPTYSPSLLPQQMQETPEAAPEAEPANERELEAHEVPVPEDRDLEDESFEEAARQEWQQQGENQRRQRLVDDVPFSIKRKLAGDDGAGLPIKRPRVHASWIVQAMTAAADSGPANEWVSRHELETLRRLTGLPLSAARIHRRPRKRLMRPPKLVSRSRLSILIGEDPKDAFVVEEDEKQVTAEPRRKVSFYWKGMTMLYKRCGRKPQATYIQLPDGTYKASLSAEQRRAFEELWLEELKDVLVNEVMLLKLKQNGKELDPRWFNPEEKKAFDISDATEWSQWLNNEVVEKVKPEDLKKVPRHQIFKAPLRMVRTNKAAAATLPLVAKSRLVVPGHRDPGLGEFRTDAPTVGATATKIAKAIAQARRWVVWAFDVTTAFLSGERTDRQIYVRAPPEGLPKTKQMEEVTGGQLFRVLKSAYGLTEAPRLWYLKACKLLAQTPLKELDIAKATFTAWDENGTWAILCLHVDDGLLMGSATDPRFTALKEQINSLFNIKAWQSLPLTFLGVDLYRENGILVDSMKKYIEEIRVPEMEKENPEKELDAAGLTKYRQLVMRLRWPAQQVMPHMLYEISRLAQRVSGATYGDFQDALKVYKMLIQEKDAGRAVLKYPEIPGELCLVSYFDASLGKEKDGKSQLGQIHFITNTDVVEGPQPAAVVDFGSSKSTRVVRSSMAAEAASMSQAIDRHLYARLLIQMLTKGIFKLSRDWRMDLKVPGFMVTNARSLFDHLGTTGQVPSERQTMLDLMVTREMLEANMFHLRWVPTYKQYADGLTKKMNNPLWSEFSEGGLLSLKETEKEAEFESHRKSLRKAQRERRKKRFADGRAAASQSSSATGRTGQHSFSGMCLT